MKKGLQERELHLSIPRGSRNNPVTSSQAKRKSNKEKKNVNDKEAGEQRERKQSTVVQYEGGWEIKSGNVSKERQNCKRRRGKKRKAVESFKWKLCE